MTQSLQDITPQQVAALSEQSKAAYDEAVNHAQQLIDKNPDLHHVVNQKVHPQSLCGCGCEQNICGYFSFHGCGCGCAPHTEIIQIDTSIANIGPNAPQQGTVVRFVGQATGTGTNIDINNVYLQGSVPDAEKVIGVQLNLELSISQGALTLKLLDGPRVIAVLVHPSQYAANISGQFYGSGVGMFLQV